MSNSLLFAVCGILLWAIGLGGMLLLQSLLRRILAFNVMGSGTFLVLVGLAQRHGISDPVPQAMVLTGIVVAVAATALAIALTRRLYMINGAKSLDHADN
jgi:multicomponent Na+:H+ antiporter subunit C